MCYYVQFKIVIKKKEIKVLLIPINQYHIPYFVSVLHCRIFPCKWHLSGWIIQTFLSDKNFEHEKLKNLVKVYLNFSYF